MESCIACGGQASFEAHGMAVCGKECVVDVWNRVNDDVRKSIAEQRFKGPMDLAPLEIQELWQDLREYGVRREFRDSRHRFDEFVFDDTLLEGYDGYARLKGERKLYRVQKLNLNLGALAFGGPGPFNRFIDAMMLQSHELSKQFAVDESLRKIILDYRSAEARISDDGASMIMRHLEHHTVFDFVYMVAPAIIGGNVYALVYFADDAGGPGREDSLDEELALELIFKLSFGRSRFANLRWLVIGIHTYLDGQVYGPLSRYTEAILTSEPTMKMSWQLLRYLSFKKTNVHYEPYAFSDKMALIEAVWQIVLNVASPFPVENMAGRMQFFGLTDRDLKERDLQLTSKLNETHGRFVERVIERFEGYFGHIGGFLAFVINLISSPIRIDGYDYFTEIKRAFVNEWITRKLRKVSRWPGAIVGPNAAEEPSQASSSDESSSEESSEDSSDEGRFEPRNPKRTRVVESRMRAKQ